MEPLQQDYKQPTHASADDVPVINEKNNPVQHSEKGDPLDTYMDNDNINMDT